MAYRVLVADPPWLFGDRLPGKTRGAVRQYQCMTVDQIKGFALPALADDCVLFLWRVSAMQREALDVATAWGFSPTKGELVWCKLTATGKRHFGMGRIVRGEHETCLIATRGRPVVKRHDVRSTFSAVVPRRNGKIVHSAKPGAFFELVTSLFDGPRASVFERVQRVGFDCYGEGLTP